MNQKYTTKQKTLLRYISVPAVTSNRFSILENSQHTCENVSEQPQITSSWADVVMSRQNRVACGKRQNTSRIPAAKNCSNLPCKCKRSKKLTSAKRAKQDFNYRGRHGRVCASKVKCNLENCFEVQGVINPGAGLTAITNSVKEEVKLLTKKAVVVVWGGTREVGKNETKNRLNQIKDFF